MKDDTRQNEKLALQLIQTGKNKIMGAASLLVKLQQNPQVVACWHTTTSEAELNYSSVQEYEGGNNLVVNTEQFWPLFTSMFTLKL